MEFSAFEGHSSQTVRPRNSSARRHTTNGYPNSHVFAREESVSLGRAALAMLGEKIRGPACAALHEETSSGHRETTCEQVLVAFINSLHT
jgi:hypothetical protein